MKRTIVNILATTCAVILLLMITGNIIHGRTIQGTLSATIPVYLILQLLAANTVIHLGMILTRKFESKYFVLEYLLDISFIIIVLLVFNAVFNWHPYTPWVLAIMAVIIYIISVLISIVRMREDAKKLNQLLAKRKGKNKDKGLDTAS